MASGLTVVVPAFNEEASLREAITILLASVGGLGIPLEVVIVDDGSTDGTGEIAENLAHDVGPVRVVHHGVNQGWGEAVRTGIANAKHEFIVLSPVDNPVTGPQMVTFLEALSGADIVIGYRLGRAGYSPWLAFASRCYYFLVKYAFDLPFRDVNWIHVYRKTVIETIPLRLSGIVFPAEVLAKAHRRGYKIVEVHSEMKARTVGRPTVSRPRVMAKAMADLARLWLEVRREGRRG